MSNISTYSTTAASNNNAAPNGAPEGMAPSGVNDTIREIMAGISKWYGDTDGTLVTAGSSNAYTLTTNNVHAALADQSTIVFRADRANTGAVTLDVDSLGAKSVKVNHDEELSSGDMQADGMYIVIYNVTSDIYEIFGVQAPADGSITTAKLASDISVPFPRGHIGGLQCSNAADADHDVTISIGECRDFGNTANLSITSALTKQIDASWAVGTNAGGLANGVSLSADTWYHFFLVDLDAGGTDAGFDTSLTAANLLSTTGVGTKYRIIWSVLTDSSNNIEAFTQIGNNNQWPDPNTFQNLTTAASSTTAALITVSSPLGLKTKTYMSVAVDGANTGALYFSDPDVSDIVPTTTNGRFTINRESNINSSNSFHVYTDISSRIRWRGSVAGINTNAATIGFDHPRGRFD